MRVIKEKERVELRPIQNPSDRGDTAVLGEAWLIFFDHRRKKEVLD